VTTLHGALRRIHQELATLGVPHALIGGLAVSAHTEPRFTRDADLAVAPASDTQAEEPLRRLRLRGYEIQALVEQDAAGRLATARLAHQGEGRLWICCLHRPGSSQRSLRQPRRWTCSRD
jgi:hypothetical protein